MKARKYLMHAMLLTLALMGGGQHAVHAHPGGGLADVSRIDTLWPHRVWSIPWRFTEKSFPHELFCGPELGPVFIIKGFTVDDRERFYVIGGEPKASIACYEGENQVWYRQLPFSLNRSVYGLLKAKGDSIYSFDEERFRLRRMHRDGHGKVAYADLHLPAEDSVVWACVYEDRFRLQVINKHDVGYWQLEFTVPTRFIDVYLDGHVDKSDEEMATINSKERVRMYGGGNEVDVNKGYDDIYIPFFVKTSPTDTLRELRFYGNNDAAIITSVNVPGNQTLMPASINA